MTTLMLFVGGCWLGAIFGYATCAAMHVAAAADRRDEIIHQRALHVVQALEVANAVKNKRAS